MLLIVKLEISEDITKCFQGRNNVSIKLLMLPHVCKRNQNNLVKGMLSEVNELIHTLPVTSATAKQPLHLIKA